MTRELLVVGGPNGAGKTTFAEAYVAQHPCDYLSADAIAKELSPRDPALVQIEAGREFLKRIHEAIATGTQFVVESTLSGRTFQRVLHAAKALGYEITIHFLWLDSADTSVERVRKRTQKGGHNVPESDVRRRFGRSIQNFWSLYRPLSDHWSLIYNSGNHPITIALGTPTRISIRETDLFVNFQSFVSEPH